MVEGDYVIYYGDGAMNTTVESDRLQYAEVTPTEDKITNPDASIIWHIAQSGEYWTIYNSAAQAYAASTGAKNKAQMLADGTDDKPHSNFWPPRMIDRNMSGPDVEVLQAILKARGYAINYISGKFDDLLTEKVKQFQSDNHLISDGVCGPKTWAAIVKL